VSRPVLYEKRGDGVAILTLNRPEARNAISEFDMIEAIVNALRAADADKDVRALVLTGAGSVFSSGGNLRKLDGEEGAMSALPVETRRRLKAGIQRMPLAFEALDVPVIAAVNGPAIGAGCDLACMCDIRIAAQSARFAVSFVKLGLVPGDGGAWLLPRAVGFSKATEMMLTGDPIGADEALACGLVSRVVPDAELFETALNTAGRIAINPTHAVRMTKQLIRQSHQSRLDVALELAASMQALAHATADHREAMAAYLAKRSPVFIGE
jgi:enoyl-CoA hydratase/carnithine racemase